MTGSARAGRRKKLKSIQLPKSVVRSRMIRESSSLKKLRMPRQFVARSRDHIRTSGNQPLLICSLLGNANYAASISNDRNSAMVVA